MRPITIAGLVLIVLGALALAFQGISYTDKKTIVDFGPVEATAETEETIPLPPVMGGLAIAGGVVLLLYGSRRKAEH